MNKTTIYTNKFTEATGLLFCGKTTLIYFSNIMKNYKLETIAFLSGALVMILELTGSRVLSPYFGNSIYIWTGMIGVILGFLSLGYYYGGIIADKGASPQKLAQILWLAGICTFLIATFKEPVLQFFAAITSGDIKTGSLFSIIFLFGGVSTLLGAVTPMVIKLKLDSLKNVGADIGKIYALSTMGSITGTFLSGYSLIPLMGNTSLIYFVALILLVLSVWVYPKLNSNKFVTLVILYLLYYLRTYLGLFQISAIADIDTTYNRILIRDVVLNQKDARVFMTDRLGIQSAIYKSDNTELATEYSRAFAGVTQSLPRSRNALIVGGAGFVFPAHFVSKNLGEKMDVVEIDPAMLKIAKKYFYFKEVDRLQIYADDARNFIQKTKNIYDLIFLDAFNSIAPPHHLTTDTFIKNIAGKLSKDGTLVVNLVSSVSGKNSRLLSWQYSTLRETFSQVTAYKTNPSRPENEIQNIILVAHNNTDDKINTAMLPSNMKLLNASKIYDKDKILTDDYAPVEHLAGGFMGSN